MLVKDEKVAGKNGRSSQEQAYGQSVYARNLGSIESSRSTDVTFRNENLALNLCDTDFAVE